MSDRFLPSRRHVVAGLGGVLATPFIWRRASAATQLVIRTTGGVYDDIMRRSVYDAFSKATGIEVVTAPAPMSKLIAMYKAGGAEFDVIDTGDGGLLNLERLGALTPIAYDSWKYGKPDEIIKELDERQRNYYFPVIAEKLADQPLRLAAMNWGEPRDG